MTNWIIYHQTKAGIDCPDGIMAAAIASLAMPDAKVLPDVYKHSNDYGNPAGQYPGDHFRSGDNVFVVDFSYPANWLKHWELLGVSLTVIDHHARKFPMLEGFAGAILDENECGATLAWKHFFPTVSQPLILEHVRRRDIGADNYYEGDCYDSEAINETLSLIRHKASEKVEAMITVLNCTSGETGLSVIKFMQYMGKNFLVERDQLIEGAIPRHRLSILDEFNIPFVKLERSEDRVYSLVGNRLAKLYPDKPFAWIQTSDGRNHLRSTRHNGNFDTAVIAERRGGGGHRNASGFPPFREA